MEELKREYEQDKEQALKEFRETIPSVENTLKGLQDSFTKLVYVFDNMINMINDLKNITDKQQTEIASIKAELTNRTDIDTIQLHNNTKAV